jgi:multiple antibiotic resistance protein
MKNEYVIFAITIFTGFFAIMNPIANTPIFMGLVEGKDDATKKQIAKKATITAFLIVVSFIILGKYIFQLFGITIPSFKITGGILIFYVGLGMLRSHKSGIHSQLEVENDNEIATSPLAIPILAGPGTIITAMNSVTNANYTHIAIVIASFGSIVYLTYLAFKLSDKIIKVVGINLITVVSKLMGLILAIMGTGMIISGIKLAFDI